MPSPGRPPLAITLLTLSLAAASLAAAAHRSSQSGTGVPPVTPPSAHPRQQERLDRALIALTLPSGGVFLSWRSLRSDPPTTTFHIWRASPNTPPARLTPSPLSGPTSFTDPTPPADASYSIQSILPDSPTSPPSPPVRPLKEPFLRIPVDPPKGYTPNDAAPGDLDGDGAFDLVIHHTGRSLDNSKPGLTDPPVFEARSLSGRKFWSIHLGPNLREGAHYNPFLVFDFDGDGRAEFVCRTADGSIDGTGKPIGNPSRDWRSLTKGPTYGRILDGPEYLTVFDGLTGAALASAPFSPPRGKVSDWGDSYGNRSDRFLATVAFLDGARPSIVMTRGYYQKTTLAAWDWRNGSLSLRWLFDSSNPQHLDYSGQGNHNLAVADVDHDSRDEIIYGSMAIDDHGAPLWNSKLGHGDALHLADLIPSRPGLELFGVHEKVRHPHGIACLDAASGAILWSRPAFDTGRGLACDIDPRHDGSECWASGFPSLFSSSGQPIGPRPRSTNMAVWWDGDLLRELLDSTSISKWNWESHRESSLLAAHLHGAASNNSSKATPCLSADLLGDWREEVIWRSRSSPELLLFSSSIPTPHRIPSLMQDHVYRMGTAWQNAGYNQPPHTSSPLSPSSPR